VDTTKNKILIPEFINIKDGSFLHRFSWLSDEHIGELDKEWNWLATEYEQNNMAKVIHYTLGTPCFEEYQDSDMSQYWHNIYRKLKTPL
jgi:hypothetical protein